jgi:hypothetical protein
MDDERANDLRAFALLQEAALQAAETIEFNCPVNPFLRHTSWLEDRMDEAESLNSSASPAAPTQGGSGI